MLDMILALKECLALVLVTGLLTGLFFAKARNKEEYEPVIDEIKEKIDHTQEEILEIENNCNATLENIENEKANTQKVQEEIADLESRIKTHQEEFLVVENSLEKLKEKYAPLSALLKAQTDKINNLKSQIGDFTPEALLEKEKAQREKLIQLKNQLKKETQTLQEISLRHKNLKAQRDELYEEMKPLEKSAAQIKELLKKAKEKEMTIEDTLKEKISSLKNDHNNWLEKIKKYKAELLKLKES